MPTKRASDMTVSRRFFGQPPSHRRNNPVRTGLYARVSTHDQQTLPLQGRAMRDYVGRLAGRLPSRLKRPVPELRYRNSDKGCRSLGLPSLFEDCQRDRSNRRVRTRMHGDVAGVGG